MYKRVTKRQQKKDEAEDLGLDEDDRKIYEQQDTDTDESDSDSDGDASDNPSSTNQDEIADEEEEKNVQKSFVMSMEQIRDSPIVKLIETSMMHSCLVCPGKLFRDPTGKDAKAHLQSSTHTRRLKKIFEAMITLGSGPADISKVVESLKVQKAVVRDPDILTNRAQKRKAKLQIVKEKREVRKEMKMKKIARKKRRDEEKSKAALSYETVNDPEGNGNVSVNTDMSEAIQEAHDTKSKKRKRPINAESPSHNADPSKEPRKKKKRKSDGTATAVATALEPQLDESNKSAKPRVTFKEPEKSTLTNENKDRKLKRKALSFANASTSNTIRYYDDKGDAGKKKSKLRDKGGSPGKLSKKEWDKGPVLQIFE